MFAALIAALLLCGRPLRELEIVLCLPDVVQYLPSQFLYRAELHLISKPKEEEDLNLCFRRNFEWMKIEQMSLYRE